jgi:hypothetical protein
MITDVRNAIATSLQKIDGLHVSAYRPAPILPTPCAFIVLGDIDYGLTLPRLTATVYYDIVLLISRTKDLKESQLDVDSYLDPTSETSNKYVVEHGTYPTEVSSIMVQTMRQYGGHTFDETPYVGCIFRVRTF